MLAFALVGREPEVAAVGEVELLVDVEDGLDEVVAGGEGGEVGERVADGLGVDDEWACRERGCLTSTPKPWAEV